MTSTNPFHEGEERVQAQAGVRASARRIGGSIKNFIPPIAAQWLESQVLAAVASRDEAGAVWASLLTGHAGFLHAPDEHTLNVTVDWPAQDPLHEALLAGEQAVGLIVLEPMTRRRMRLNGVGHLTDSGMSVAANEVYSNCPKYIQTRTPSETHSRALAHSIVGTELSKEQGELITRADTFFIATAHPQGGADCSHRGGQPGFVRVVGNGSTAPLEWEDYAGNAMFNTLGNLEVNPRCGLLFLDWKSGLTLQLNGEARTRWHETGRTVQMEVHGWRETHNATTIHWQFGEFSPFNP